VDAGIDGGSRGGDGTVRRRLGRQPERAEQAPHGVGLRVVDIKSLLGRVPWGERPIGTLRRECLDHVVVLNETHLRRLLREYLIDYHGARTHLSLAKDAPEPRRVERLDEGRMVEMPMVGGLHHRYGRRAA
jgi:hypothetical protein